MAKPRFNIAGTDSEALATLSRWWYEYGKYAVAGLALALAGFGGWYGRDYHRENLAVEAAALYAALAKEFETGAVDDVSPEWLSLQDYANTPYLSFAYLRRAKYFVEHGKLEEAAEDLRWVAENSVQPTLSQLAYIRFARTLISLGEIDEARAVLIEPEFHDSFIPLIEEVRGDIFLVSNDTPNAIASYRTAWDTSIDRSEFLRLKLESLGQQVDAPAQ